MGIPVVSDQTKKVNRVKAHRGYKIVFATSVLASVFGIVALTIVQADSRFIVSMGIYLLLNLSLNYYYLTVFRRFASQLQ